MHTFDPPAADLAERVLLDEVPRAFLERAEAVREADLSGDRLDVRLDELERIRIAEPHREL